jgi:hypothetical protein
MSNKLFNETAEEFFKDLVNGFPATPEYEVLRAEFATMKLGFNFIKTCDEKKPQRVFSSYVVARYRQHIMDEDERFFLETAAYDISGSSRKDYWIDFISKIKTAWALMDDESKKIIWRYFKLLTFLSDKCDAK